jgi:hypothetical protein
MPNFWGHSVLLGGFMHMLRVLCFVSVFFFLSASAFAQTTTPATSDPQAVALIQQSLGVLTGSATVISDVTLTGSAQRIAGSDSETGTATLMAMAPAYSKLSLDLPSGLRSEIRNPAGTPPPGSVPPGVLASVSLVQPVGAWSGPNGVLNPIAQQNLMTDAVWFCPVFTLTNVVASQAYVLSYVGPSTLNGQAVLHVSAIQQFSALSNAPAQTTALLQHLSQMDFYLNATTLLPVALVFNVHPDTNALTDIPTEIVFSNYQAVSGVQVPLHVQKYLNNVLALDLQFTNAVLNSGLSASSFQIQ